MVLQCIRFTGISIFYLFYRIYSFVIKINVCLTAENKVQFAVISGCTKDHDSCYKSYNTFIPSIFRSYNMHIVSKERIKFVCKCKNEYFKN